MVLVLRLFENPARFSATTVKESLIVARVSSRRGPTKNPTPHRATPGHLGETGEYVLFALLPGGFNAFLEPGQRAPGDLRPGVQIALALHHVPQEGVRFVC